MTNQFATMRIERKHLQCIIAALCGGLVYRQTDQEMPENRRIAAEWMLINEIIEDCFDVEETCCSIVWGNGLNRLNTMQLALLLAHILNGKGNPVITRVLDAD